MCCFIVGYEQCVIDEGGVLFVFFYYIGDISWCMVRCVYYVCLQLVDLEGFVIGEEMIELVVVVFEFGVGVEEFVKDLLYLVDVFVDGDVVIQFLFQVGCGGEMVGMCMCFQNLLYCCIECLYMGDQMIGVVGGGVVGFGIVIQYVVYQCIV